MNDTFSLPVLTTEYVTDGVRVDELDFTNCGLSVAPFKASIISIAPGCSSPVDQHEVRECWVTIGGSGQLQRDDDFGQLQPGSVVYFASQQKHQVHNFGDVPLTIFSTWWKP
jgi:mannose-6-phosphate isomerase-like protein (cupin superfamily)